MAHLAASMSARSSSGASRVFASGCGGSDSRSGSGVPSHTEGGRTISESCGMVASALPASATMPADP
eukprot:scaffold229415_cov29-Tisochrysis_lutea.AAC.2